MLLTLRNSKVNWTIFKGRLPFHELGLALIICGAQLGFYLNIMVSSSGWNSILYPLAIILVIDWGNILRLRLKNVSKPLLILLGFQFIVWIYYFSSPWEIPEKVNLYMLFTLAEIIGVMSLNYRKISIANVINITYCISMCCIIAGIYIFIFNKEAILRSAGEDIEEAIFYGYLTASSGCVVALISSLFIAPKNKVLKLVRVASIITCLILIVFLGKRTALIVSAFVLTIYFIKISKGFNVKQIISFFGYIALGLIIILVINPQSLLEEFDKLIEYTSSGIYDMINGTQTSGNSSANGRYRAMEWALDKIGMESSVFSMFFGFGFMTRWLDIPILQSFLDMGIFGFLFYLSYVILTPVFILFSKLSANKYILFACMLNFYNIISCFNSGHPYLETKWWPCIFLLFVVYGEMRIEKSLRSKSASSI